MRSYEARIYHDATIDRVTIVARNIDEARREAFRVAYNITGYGSLGYLEHVVVMPVKKKA